MKKTQINAINLIMIQKNPKSLITKSVHTNTKIIVRGKALVNMPNIPNGHTFNVKGKFYTQNQKKYLLADEIKFG